MNITDRDITFELKGKRYKVPYVIMADHAPILHQMQIWGQDLSMYEYEGRKLRMKDALLKMNYNRVIEIFSRKECKQVLTSCFFENVSRTKVHSRATALKQCKEIIRVNIKEWLRQIRINTNKKIITGPEFHCAYTFDNPEEQILKYAYHLYCEKCLKGERWNTIDGETWSAFWRELYEYMNDWKAENEKPTLNLSFAWNF